MIITRITTDELYAINHGADLFTFASKMAKELENTPFNIKLDPFHFAQVSMQNIYNPNCGYFIACENNVIVGIISCIIIDSMASSDRMATEDFFGVLQSHRSSAGTKLIKEALCWSKSENCKHFMLGLNKMFHSCDRVDKLYKAIGFQEYEKIYIKEII